ncbi:response regulator [Iocasia frigidifontis]|uniref:Stage 0 sporulation protein A homolog n=1 Tax=Iocasia fonsfrigidae TaxID=2682810 RepID=A0A8A7KB50_9FIRM|nr:response regulator transcription factor [Iocasia fonsfrigidae]QTL96758.1 response regulator [Iocasia fonsfrigidae]
MEDRILIIEDEKQIARFMELELTHEGYQVVVEYNGKEGLVSWQESDFSLIILDIMLPGLDGIELCQRIRRESNIPIIMVTAKDSTSDKVKGLDIGADDYLTKPFVIEELLARIRALLRRNINSNEADKRGLLKVDNLVVDQVKYRVSRAEEVIELTKKEYDLLVYLLINKGMVLSREKILNDVWGYDYVGETNIVDVYIRYLRSKIDDPYQEKLIQTVRGVGYVIKDEQG